ncbi:MAG: hypothetical protein IJK02_10655 [Clostridia bacterium]|nr:hypothetical protein [Clostridia bacterium]MBR0509438.1 hypothetical protein [Clostridia bacterium]
MLIDKYTIYKETDEVDHLTIRVRKGEALDRALAIKMIKRYTGTYPAVAAALPGLDTSLPALEAKDDRELYDLLIVIRTALTDLVFGKQD